MNSGTWDATIPQHWADAIGLVNVPLFGERTAEGPRQKHSVLLDGRKLSFLLLSADDRAVSGWEPASWAWSAHIEHIAVVDSRREELLLRGWSSRRAPQRFRLPASERGAVEFVKRLEEIDSPSEPGVIDFVLKGFRIIRDAVRGTDALDAVRVFNAMLVGTDLVLRGGQINREQWTASSIVGDAIALLPQEEQRLTGSDKLSAATTSAPLGAIPSVFLRPDPVTGCYLQPELLLRHAAGQLYQEAHLQLERDESQLRLPGLSDVNQPRGLPLRPDVRFTPSNLARAIAEQAVRAWGQLKSVNKIQVLDPACGSGIFLQEVLRELLAKQFSGSIELTGVDLSPISSAMAQFALERARRDSGQEASKRITIEISNEDALAKPWGTPDLVLMNPPFVGWREMTSAERTAVVSELEATPDANDDESAQEERGRPDMAMAFVTKAMKSLKPGGVMASVLPAPLLENTSGEGWRRSLLKDRALLLVGRFEDYGIFSGAIVEPAFVILKQGTPGHAEVPSEAGTRVLYAKQSFKDLAIRALRLNGVGSIPGKAEVYDVPSRSFNSATWTPRPAAFARLVGRFSEMQFPRVGQLFDVQQGAITGANSVFVLDPELMDQLEIPEAERRFFRPIASNSTISEGLIDETEFVWYPYDEKGAIIKNVEELRTTVPIYYKKVLEPNEDHLRRRARITDDNWWLLSEHRAWQQRREPKLVSTYFGRRGSFAYDQEGRCVVLQGYRWNWRGEERAIREPDEDEISEEPIERPFHRSLLPWAYLALLNSRVFEYLLEHACPRVRGGQFNLSKRFVSQVFLPDLSDERYGMDETLVELAALGKSIYIKEPVSAKRLDPVSARAYRVRLSDLEGNSDE